jgi:hypothetical protein
MKSLTFKWKQSIAEGGLGALLVFIVMGFFILGILFSTVHNRTDNEFKNRINPRWENAIMVWIEHGYFKHAGLRFEKPGDEDPKQLVWGSIGMGFIQANHLLQRIHFGLTGKSSPRLTAISNQLFALMASIILGLLAMRLILGLGICPWKALLLGIGTQTVFQTFPINLGVLWDISPQNVATAFMLLFLLIEERVCTYGDSPKLQFFRGLAVFLLFYADHKAGWFGMLPYIMIRALTAPKGFSFTIVFRVIIIPMLIAYGIHISQLILVKINFPDVVFKRSVEKILGRTGFDGNTTYYLNHIDLLRDRWLLNLPSWHILFYLGSLALIALIVFVQLNKKYLIQQTILLAGLGMYIPVSFFLTQSVVIHPYSYQQNIASVMILALFALLPAWLEKYNKHTGIFVLFASLAAFATSGLQLLSYWIYMPPWPVI